MKIDILTSDGSPIGCTMKTLMGTDQSQVGCGGSEYALLTLCEEWSKQHEVVLYNSPREFGVSPFEQRNISDFDPHEKRDVLINFRSPNPKTIVTDNCLKVWFTCDQFSVGDYAAFAPNVDKIVCISPRHKQYFEQTYGIKNAIVIDLPIRTQDFDEISVNVKKVKNRIIFTSVPARGLDNLWRIYPQIQREIPDVSLVITSDYRLWGVGASNEHFRVRWLTRTNTEYFGAMPRARYIEELLKSQITLYPSNYDELFCVSIAESQYAGSYPITSATGALPTTNMGTVLNADANDPHSDRSFIDATVGLLNNIEEMEYNQLTVHQLAKKRFSPDIILKQWQEKVFK